MAVFYCDTCHRNHDADDTGYVVLPDGREVCHQAEDSYREAQDWAAMTPRQQRDALGGPYGGDGPDD